MVKNYADGDSVPTVLDPWFFQLMANKYLEEKIYTCIPAKDEIADAASDELASIRRKIRQQSAKIRESLQKIISSPSYAKILREPIITIRSDRFVVPVKSECKNDLPGLVHDVSASGSIVFHRADAGRQCEQRASGAVCGRAEGDRAHPCGAFSECANYRTHIEENYHCS